MLERAGGRATSVVMVSLEVKPSLNKLASTKKKILKTKKIFIKTIVSLIYII